MSDPGTVDAVTAFVVILLPDGEFFVTAETPNWVNKQHPPTVTEIRSISRRLVQHIDDQMAEALPRETARLVLEALTRSEPTPAQRVAEALQRRSMEEGHEG